LIRPALGLLDRIPEPQAVAIEGALALRPARAQERFAVGAATLTLLASYAEHGAVAVLVDDAHWLDGPSAEALLFAVRRLADPIAVLIAIRESEPSLLDGADLPTARIESLSREGADSLRWSRARSCRPAAQCHRRQSAWLVCDAGGSVAAGAGPQTSGSSGADSNLLMAMRLLVVVHLATLGPDDREAAFVAMGQVARQSAAGSGTPSLPRGR
jgi:hypothetical protein